MLLLRHHHQRRVGRMMVRLGAGVLQSLGGPGDRVLTCAVPRQDLVHNGWATRDCRLEIGSSGLTWREKKEVPARSHRIVGPPAAPAEQRYVPCLGGNYVLKVQYLHYLTILLVVIMMLDLHVP